MKQKWFRWLGLLVMLLAGSVAGHGQPSTVNNVEITYDNSKPLESTGPNSTRNLTIKVMPQTAGSNAQRIAFTIPKATNGRPLVDIKPVTTGNHTPSGKDNGNTGQFDFTVSANRDGDVPREGEGEVTFRIYGPGLNDGRSFADGLQKFTVTVADKKVTGITVELETGPDNHRDPIFFDLRGSCRAKVTFTPSEATDKTVRLASGSKLTLVPEDEANGIYILKAGAIANVTGKLVFEARGSETPYAVKTDPPINVNVENAALTTLTWVQLNGDNDWPEDGNLLRGSTYQFCMKVEPSWLTDPSKKIKFIGYEGLSAPKLVKQEKVDGVWQVTYQVAAKSDVTSKELKAGATATGPSLLGGVTYSVRYNEVEDITVAPNPLELYVGTKPSIDFALTVLPENASDKKLTVSVNDASKNAITVTGSDGHYTVSLKPNYKGGTATARITATAGGKTVDIPVEIKYVPVTGVQVTVNPSASPKVLTNGGEIVMAEGETVELDFRLLPYDKDNVTNCASELTFKFPDLPPLGWLKSANATNPNAQLQPTTGVTKGQQGLYTLKGLKQTESVDLKVTQGTQEWTFTVRVTPSNIQELFWVNKYKDGEEVVKPTTPDTLLVLANRQKPNILTKVVALGMAPKNPYNNKVNFSCEAPVVGLQRSSGSNVGLVLPQQVTNPLTVQVDQSKVNKDNPKQMTGRLRVASAQDNAVKSEMPVELLYTLPTTVELSETNIPTMNLNETKELTLEIKGSGTYPASNRRATIKVYLQPAGTGEPVDGGRYVELHPLDDQAYGVAGKYQLQAKKATNPGDKLKIVFTAEDNASLTKDLLIGEVKNTPVKGITLDPPEFTLTVGGEAQTVRVTFDPADALNKELTWTSRWVDVERVSDTEYKLRAKANAPAGETSVVATANGGTNVKATLKVNINVIDATSVTIETENPLTLSRALYEGKQVPVVVKVTPATVSTQEVVVSYAGPLRAAGLTTPKPISEERKPDGLYLTYNLKIGAADGERAITFTHQGASRQKAELKVTTVTRHVESFSFDPPQLSALQLGSAGEKVRILYEPSDAYKPSFTWNKLGNVGGGNLSPAIISVSPDGEPKDGVAVYLVKPLRPGVATAEVKDSRVGSTVKTRTYSVAIQGVSVTSMTLEPTSVALNLEDNRTAEFDLAVQPQGAVLENLVWEGIYQHNVACLEITELPDKTKHDGGYSHYYYQARSTRATDLGQPLKVMAACSPKSGVVKSNTCEVTIKQYVPAVSVESLTMNPDKLELTVGGEPKEITVTFTPANASLKEVGWKETSGKRIEDYLQTERIKEEGAVVTYKLTPKKATTTALNLKVSASDVTGIESTNSCEVTIAPQAQVKLEKIDVTPNPLLMTLGTTKEVYIQYTPSNASERDVTASSSSDVVRVSNGGSTGTFIIAAEKVGEAEVTFKATDGSIRTTLKVTVKAQPTGLLVLASDGVSALPNPVALKVGENKRVKVKVEPATALQKVSYKVEPEEMLTVAPESDNLFNLVAAKAGTGKVTFTSDDGSQTKAINVTVTAMEYTITYGPTSGANGFIEVYNETVKVESGTKLPAGTPLTVKVLPGQGQELEKLTVDGTPVQVSDNTYAFTLTGNMNVQATFRAKAMQQVTVTVKNGVNMIDGAKVILGSVAGTTDGTGIARLSMPASQTTKYNLSVYKQGYYEYNGQVDLSKGTAIEVELTAVTTPLPTTAKVTFTVVDATTGDAIENATVKETQGGAPATSLGEGKFELTVHTSKAYNFVITAEGYEQQYDGFVVSGDMERLVKLTKKQPVAPGTTYKLTVKVYSQANPLANAIVQVEETALSQTTADDGLVTFDLAPGLYNLKVSCEGHYAQTLGIALTGIQQVVFSLEAQKPGETGKGGVVTLTVLDAQGPVAGAKVVPDYRNQETQTTDNNGEARLTLHEEAHFNVEVTKEGYHNAAVPVDVTQGNVSRVVFLRKLDTPLPAQQYKLTVVVRGAEGLLQDAEVVVLGTDKSAKSNTDGEAVISGLDNGLYSLEISCTDYSTVSEQVEIAGANARLNVVLTKPAAPATPESQFVLTVTVTDQVSHEALHNVKVFHGSKELGETDDKGLFTKELLVGSYSLTFSHAGYREASLAALLTDGPRSYKVSMLKKDAPVTATEFKGIVRVMHYNAAKQLVPLEGVKITVVGSDPVKSATSDAHGVAKLENLSNGVYQLELVLANFVTQHAVLQVQDADAELALTMRQETGDPVFEQATANITFIVKDEKGKAIEGATVTVKTATPNSPTTDARGMAVVKELENGTYDYEVEKKDFTPFSGQLTAAGVDEQLLVVLKRSVPPTAQYTLTVEVSDADGALQGATVELTPAGGAAVTKTTEADGKAAFAELAAGNYTLKVSKDGYTAKSDIAITLEGDKTEKVTLEKSGAQPTPKPKPDPNAVEAHALASVTLYPNPVDDYFVVKCEEQVARIRIYNVLGLQVLEQSILQQGQSVSVDGLPSGTYLVKVEAQSGEAAVLRIVKR